MYQCPCCDHFTLDERGGYDICPVCFWEDDGLDVDQLDVRSGPNHMTLREGRHNFERLGACEARLKVHVLPEQARSQFKHEARPIAARESSRMTTVRIDGTKITDWPSFFDEFVLAFGFPDYFGRNMDAWIDCMTCLDEEMSAVQVAPGEYVCIALDAADVFKAACPEQYQALLECAAFVNWRRIDKGEAPILMLSFNA